MLIIKLWKRRCKLDLSLKKESRSSIYSYQHVNIKIVYFATDTEIQVLIWAFPPHVLHVKGLLRNANTLEG